MQETFFDVYVGRCHESKVQTLKMANMPDIETPLAQDAVARVRFTDDALDARNNRELAQAAGKVLAELDPEFFGEDGGPWRVEAVHDAYDFVAPKPVPLEMDSPAGYLLQAMLWEHPSFYGADEFAPFRVLEAWFCAKRHDLAWGPDGLLHHNGKAPGAELLAEVQRRVSKGKHQEELEEFCVGSPAWAHPTIDVPVKLSPLSQCTSLLFSIPDNVDDSFLRAAVAFMQYVFSRPVWENFATDPEDLVNETQSLYLTDEWRHIVLADGMRNRTPLEIAYARMKRHPELGARIRALGIEDNSSHPLDYRLPPRCR